MTVCFAQRVDDRSKVKIGWSRNLAQRAQALAVQHGQIEIIAMFEGSTEDEAKLHQAFLDLRDEGEWFRIDERLRALISVHAVDPMVFTPFEMEWRTAQTSGQRQSDGMIAATIMAEIMGTFPATMRRGAVLEEIYQLLSESSDAWSRRRVRAIWENRARRVDLFEIVDLLKAAGIERSKWADYLAPENTEAA